MGKSVVYFTPSRGDAHKNKFDRLKRLIDTTGLCNLFEPNDLVAIKVHWGEVGNADFLRHIFVRSIADKLVDAKTKPFITDTNTLYRGSRHNAVDNIITAMRHGFAPGAINCPVVVADGLRGFDYCNVPINREFVSLAHIASAIYYSDGLVVVSHVKGHMVFGFGGALKNLGMGCAAGPAKQFLHSDIRPSVAPTKCSACGRCMSQCQFGAISWKKYSDPPTEAAYIDHTRCAGCGECIVVCPASAIPIDWGGDIRATQCKTAEYALAAVKGKEKKTVYFNFLVGITPDCDCCSWSDSPFVPDIGFLASVDPVAIDQASVDLINSSNAYQNRTKSGTSQRLDTIKSVHNVEYCHILSHAQKIGLGSRDYVLKTV